MKGYLFMFGFHGLQGTSLFWGVEGQGMSLGKGPCISTARNRPKREIPALGSDDHFSLKPALFLSLASRFIFLLSR